MPRDGGPINFDLGCHGILREACHRNIDSWHSRNALIDSYGTGYLASSDI